MINMHYKFVKILTCVFISINYTLSGRKGKAMICVPEVPGSHHGRCTHICGVPFALCKMRSGGTELQYGVELRSVNWKNRRQQCPQLAGVDCNQESLALLQLQPLGCSIYSITEVIDNCPHKQWQKILFLGFPAIEDFTYIFFITMTGLHTGHQMSGFSYLSTNIRSLGVRKFLRYRIREMLFHHDGSAGMKNNFHQSIQ